MKAKHYFRLAAINLSRRKISVLFNLLFLVSMLVLVILTFSLSAGLSKFVNMTMLSVSTRTLAVDYNPNQFDADSVLATLETLPNVVATVPPGSSRTGGQIPTLEDQAQGYNGRITFIGANEHTHPPVISGSGLGGSSNTGVIPSKFIPTSVPAEATGGYIDGETLLGETITVEYYEHDYSDMENISRGQKHTYSFQVIGVYDSDNLLDHENIIYISYEDVGQITLASLGNHDQYLPSDTNSVQVVADSNENLMALQSEIRAVGFNARPIAFTNTSFAVTIVGIGAGLSLLAAIVAFINIIAASVNAVKERTSEIGMLKAIGYQDGNVALIMLVETVLLGVAAFCMSVGTAAPVLRYLSNHWADSQTLSVLLAQVSGNGLLFASLAAIGVPIVGYLFALDKALKIPPSSALREQ